ncbi:MAG: DUF202 domain-containing protein [Proteobacteria bacterium]|nr:DUF202 domain-containing protein [Pseudomonadota bacterium]
MDDPAPDPQLAAMQVLTELSMQRSYMNTERTLAVWTRTALSLMIFGIAVDRFGELMRHPPWHVSDRSAIWPHLLSAVGGGVLVALGVVILLATGIRFLLYGLRWQREIQRHVWYHTPWLAFGFAMAMAAVGVMVLVAICVFRQ